MEMRLEKNLRNLELYKLTFSPNIIRIIKSRRIRWTEHVVCMRRGMCLGFWWENQRERDHLDDQDVGGSVLIK
jgi:hypothetical protein